MASMEIEVKENLAIGEEKKIDEGLYSRQLYVYGMEAQRKIEKAKVLLVGLGGLGVETAKNVILAGVHSVDLLDNTPVSIQDLGSQFYVTESDIGSPRAQSSVNKLRELNKYVLLNVVTDSLSSELIAEKGYTVVCVTDPLVDVSGISEHCHENGVKLVVGKVAGLAASVFVDVGVNHTVTDQDGERCKRDIVNDVTQDNPGIVSMAKRHNLQTGDYVTFEDVEGMTELNTDQPRRITVTGPFAFAIEDTTGYSAYTNGGYFQQVKVPTTVDHESMNTVLNKIKSGDTGKVLHDVYGNHDTLHALFMALDSFTRTENRMPDPTSADDVKAIVSSAQTYFPAESKIELKEALMAKLARCAGASISPMCAFLGGVVGQEVLKAVSGKFSPLNQIMYYHSGECIPDFEDSKLAQYTPQQSRYDDYIAVFGRTVQQQVQASSLFLVGAGAIGCEMLKNWALMGVATEGKSQITVTDMDSIERSNLNRQFLFRPGDVGAQKSLTAAREAKKMNPDMNIDAQEVRVAPDTQSTYDDNFWERLTACFTALDNLKARLYLDQRCVYYQKALMDSGTLGTKGNTQVVIPFKTENYGAFRDPPETEIPMCTLRNFPNKIEHTIEWARNKFAEVFKQPCEEVNNYVANEHYVDELSEMVGQQLSTLKTLKSYLVDDKPLNFDACVTWARHMFAADYNHAPKQFLHVFPPDAVTSQGTRFWSAGKRAPTPIDFDPEDELHVNYIMAAANLRAFNYGLQGSRDVDYVKQVASQVVVPEFVAKKIKIAASDEELKKMQEEEKTGTVADDVGVEIKTLTESLPAAAELKGFEMHPSVFEKDDDTNFHMDFITACSNLRARCYRIKEISKHQTKFIAGKIIPAIATTTALVTGLICLEYYKLIQEMEVEAYRNVYVNLALPVVAGSEPMPPTFHDAKLQDKGDWKWSDWDRIDIDEGDITFAEFIQLMKDRHGLHVEMVSHGAALLFMKLGNKMKKSVKKRLRLPMSQVVETVSKKQIPSNENYLILECVVVDSQEEEVDIPYVRFKFR